MEWLLSAKGCRLDWELLLKVTNNLFGFYIGLDLPADGLGGAGLHDGEVLHGGRREGVLHEVRVDGDTLGAVVSLVDPDKTVGQLEHVGPEQ